MTTIRCAARAACRSASCWARGRPRVLEIALGRIPAIVGAAGVLGDLPSHVAGLTEATSVAVLLDPALAAAGEGARVAEVLEKVGLDATVVVLPPGEPK